MILIKNLFWDMSHHRLRLVWRLVLQVLLMVAVGAVVLSLESLIAVFISLVLNSIHGLEANAVGFEQTIDGMLNSPMASAVATLISALTIIISVYAAGCWFDRRKFSDFGFHINRRWWVDLVFGFGLGGVLMGLVFLVELSAGWIKVTGNWQPRGESFFLDFGAAFLVFVCVGFYEELLFRAYYLRNIAEGFNFRWSGPRAALWIALILSSTIFGLAHLTNPNASWVSSFNIFLAGMFLGSGLLLTGEMAIPIGLHIGWNFFQGNVFGFPVSGTNAGATIIAIEQRGIDLITGGNFGPEAGLIGVGTMLLGVAVIFSWVRMTHGSTALQTRLAVYQRIAPSKTLDNALETSIINQNIP